MLPSFKILEAVAESFGVSVEDLKGRSRMKDIAFARQMTAYLLRRINDLSYPAIGRILGKDHTTAIHSYNKISVDIKVKPPVSERTNQLLASLGSIEEVVDVADMKSLTTDEVKYLEKKILAESPSKPTLETSEDVLKTLRSTDITEREANILSKYRQGMTLEEIGVAIGVTRERVRQIAVHALMKELGQKAQAGFKINVKEYMDSQKNLHRRSYSFPEKQRVAIVQEIESGTNIKDVLKKHALDKRKFLSFFPEYEDKLAIDFAEKKRWSRFYDRCRSCKTTAIPHHSLGYCDDCYTKSPEFKEMQQRSHEKHSEKRKARESAYAKEYMQRPEVKERLRKQWDKNLFGGNREVALRRDGFRCTKCGLDKEANFRKYGKDLCVRHKDENSQNNSLDNLVTLCWSCFLEVSRKNNNFRTGRTLNARRRR